MEARTDAYHRFLNRKNIVWPWQVYFQELKEVRSTRVIEVVANEECRSFKIWFGNSVQQGFLPLEVRYMFDVGGEELVENDLVDAGGPTARFLTTAWKIFFTDFAYMHSVFERSNKRKSLASSF